MTEELDKAGFGRLWSGSTGREKGRREADRQPLPSPADEGDMPLFSHDRTYAALEFRDNATRLHIQCASLPSRLPAYSYLLDIIYDHDHDSIFTLVYSFMVVEVTGRNLWPIVHAINFGRAERIREFHKKLYDPPASQKDPFIESIKITAAVLPSGEERGK
jgi:hypothetical protein